MKPEDLTKLCYNRRKELGLTQFQLAEKVGLLKHHISEFENNKRNITLSLLIRILNALSLSIS